MGLILGRDHPDDQSAGPFYSMNNTLEMYPKGDRFEAAEEKAPTLLAKLLKGERVKVDGEIYMLSERTLYVVRNECVCFRACDSFGEFLELAERWNK